MTFDEIVSSARRCRFPTGADAQGEDVWCGADTGSPRISWCPEHRARVFLSEEELPRYLRLASIEGGLRRYAREAVGDPQPGWRGDGEHRTGRAR